MKGNRWRFGDFPKNSEVCRRMPKVPEKELKIFIYISGSRVQGPGSRVQSPESRPVQSPVQPLDYAPFPLFLSRKQIDFIRFETGHTSE